MGIESIQCSPDPIELAPVFELAVVYIPMWKEESSLCVCHFSNKWNWTMNSFINFICCLHTRYLKNIIMRRYIWLQHLMESNIFFRPGRDHVFRSKANSESTRSGKSHLTISRERYRNENEGYFRVQWPQISLEHMVSARSENCFVVGNVWLECVLEENIQPWTCNVKINFSWVKYEIGEIFEFRLYFSRSVIAIYPQRR